MKSLTLASAIALSAGLLVAAPFVTATTASATASTSRVSTGAAGWGYDDYNQATGSGEKLAYPRPIARGAIPAGADIDTISQSWGGHYCAIADGAAYCWGDGGNGQLGDGNTESSALPVAVDSGGVLAGKTVVQVAAALDSTCALTADNLIACWGGNGIGQLGNGVTGGPSQYVPGLVDQTGAMSGKTIKEIVPGQYAFCALDTVGQAYCWGWDNEGQLGIGGQGNRNTPTAVDQTPLNGETFTSITGARLSHCGVTNLNKVYCWGYNRFGQLGDGSTTSRNVPTLVTQNSALANNAASVEAGENYACALRVDGEVACWGYNAAKQLGDGGASGSQSTVPVAFNDFPGRAGRAITTVAPADQATCVIVAYTETYCVGYGSDGAIGNGEFEDVVTPQRILDVPAGLNGQHLVALSGAGGSMCGVSSGKNIFCWGYNYYGYLGNGSSSPTLLPTMVSGDFLSAGEQFTDIEAGTYSSCGLTSLQRVFCWGDNGNGQLGDGTNDPSFRGLLVAGGLDGKAVVDIGVGGEHACAVVDDGSVWCWGDNGDGELGDGNTTSLPSPVQSDFTGVLPAGRTITQVTAGDSSTCALDNVGAAYCWGANYYGQLGVGDTTARYLPVAVDTSGVLSGRTLTLLELDYGTTCALDTNSDAFCWGLDSNGSLGNGLSGNQSLPTAVLDGAKPAGDSWTTIDPGESQTCGIAAGLAYCWGDNGSGQLGTGDTTHQPLPTPVVTSGALGGKTITGLAIGYYASCALDSDGIVYCWGQNDAGQNGTGDLDPTYEPNPVTIAGTTIDGMKFTKITTAGTNSIVQGIVEPTNALPSEPTSVQVAVHSNGRALVSWAEPADTGGSDISNYVVEYATAGTGPWSTPTGCSSVGAALSCTASGLNVTRNYVFRVSAINDTGQGPAVRVWLTRTPSLVISGHRSEKAAKAIIVDGTSVGLTSKSVTIRVKVRGQTSYTSYPAGRVDLAGRFAWRGEAVRRAFVFAVIDGVRSNRVAIA